MKLILQPLMILVLATATLVADPFADPIIKSVQEAHEKGVLGDKEAVIWLVTYLEQATKDHPDNKLLQAYLGSAYTLRSRDVFPGPSKWKFLQLGIKTMDEAVDSAPEDPAVRFIRAVNNYELPTIFNRRDIARADFLFLLKALENPQVAGSLNTDTLQAIYYYAGLSFKQESNTSFARSTWSDGIKLAPNSPLGEKIALELNKIKS